MEKFCARDCEPDNLKTVSEKDILRCAQILIDHFGENAFYHAHFHYYEFMIKEEIDAFNFWHQVTVAIEWMTTDKNMTDNMTQ